MKSVNDNIIILTFSKYICKKGFLKKFTFAEFYTSLIRYIFTFYVWPTSSSNYLQSEEELFAKTIRLKLILCTTLSTFIPFNEALH